LKTPTKVIDEFTNTNPVGCPIIYSVVKNTNGNALDAGFSDWLYINSDDYLELDEFKYTGGEH